MTAPADDPSAALEEIRERREVRKQYALGFDPVDASRLLAAIEAVLKRHVEAVIEDMPAPRFRYCKTCDGHPAWPCPEVQAITRELTGKGGSDDRVHHRRAAGHVHHADDRERTKVMRIWDTFLYCGLGPEPDLLRARVAELRPVYNLVHVPVCGNMTFQGDPLDYPKTDWRVPPWADGMDPRRVKQYNYVAARGEPETMWDREHRARRATANALREFGASRGDLVLHGDVDEIPSAATVLELARWRQFPVPIRLSLRFAMFAVDWEYPERKLAPVAVAYHPSMLDFASLRMGGWPVLPEGPHGWHLSSLGGEAAVRQKVHTFSHAEAIPEVEAGLADDRWIREGVFWPGLDHGEVKLTPVDVDETWPATIREPRTCPAEWFRIR